jgi:plastocyanin
MTSPHAIPVGRHRFVLAALVPVVALSTIALTGGSPAGAGTKRTTVTAVETEFKIKLSKATFSPGAYTFVAENKGNVTHALEITGPGLHDATTKLLGPGKSAKLNVTLKKGKYDVFCPVPGHKALGMNVNIAVGTAVHATANVETSKPATSGGYGY